MDRNTRSFPWDLTGGLSLSARRAWIEIAIVSIVIFCIMVALRKESVDRNRLTKKNRPSVSRSLSARRAWIEIGRALRQL